MVFLFFTWWILWGEGVWISERKRERELEREREFYMEEKKKKGSKGSCLLPMATSELSGQTTTTTTHIIYTYIIFNQAAQLISLRRTRKEKKNELLDFGWDGM